MKNKNKNFLKAALPIIAIILLIGTSLSPTVLSLSSTKTDNQRQEIMIDDNRGTTVEKSEITEQKSLNSDKNDETIEPKVKELTSRDFKIKQIRENGNVTYPDDLQDPNNSADYLIITNDTFYNPAKQDHIENNSGTFTNSLNKLAHWRAEYNGFDVAVVSVDDLSNWAEDPLDPDLNNDITMKNFIRYVYNGSWSAPHMTDGRLGYILLVGDTPYVTSHYLHRFCGDMLYPVDRWFGCIGDEDYSSPDIMIGRFSVDDYTELDVIANKTIHYEKDYDDSDDWHKKVLIVKGSTGTGPQYWGALDECFGLERLLVLGGWNVSKVADLAGDDGDDVIDNINDGRSIVIYCSGHGSPTGWVPLGFDINDLNNGDKTPIVYSLPCWTGSFQYEYDCMGETFLNTAGKGAVAFFGASTPTGGAHLFGKYLFKSIFENFKYNIGKIITDGYLLISDEFSDAKSEFNLLGDPALDLSGSKGYPQNEKSDLAISHLDINIPINENPAPKNITITTTIHNIGGDTAENISVSFIILDQIDGTQQVICNQIITEIQSKSHTQLELLLNIPENLRKLLIVKVDPENNIDEAYELNNQAGIKIAIFSTNTYVDDDYTPSTPGWEVDHFDNIQEGIDWVTENGRVTIFNGIYNENIDIDKPIWLIGEDRDSTIINGGGSGDVIFVSADYVNISGFTIQNSGNNADDAGIDLQSNYNNISGIIISNNNYGLKLIGSNNNINENIISNNNNDGIKLTSSNDNIISDNIISSNRRDGIHLSVSSDNNIYRNIISDNNVNIYLFGGSPNPWSWGPPSDYNTISENTIINNSGVIIEGDSNYNLIYHNNFIDNIDAASDEGDNNQWHDGYQWHTGCPSGGNYWSGYSGNDNKYGPYQNLQGSDSIGDIPVPIDDTPYRPRIDRYPLMYPWPWILGDLDHDDDVDIDDYWIFEAAFGLSYGEPGFRIEADYDGDGIISGIDYQIWAQHYRDYINSLPDLMVKDFSTQYISIYPDSEENKPHTTIKLKALVKNNGTEDITTPFQVTFSGINTQTNTKSNNIHIGTVEIPSLDANETAKVTIYWKLQPQISTINVFVDSTEVIEESDENNNDANIQLPSYPLWKSLTKTIDVFSKLNQQYPTSDAERIIRIAEEAISVETYTKPREYVETFEKIAELEYKLGMELEEQEIPDELLQKYQETVKHLITVIDDLITGPISTKITWDEAVKVAKIQLQICGIAQQMLK